MTNEPHSDLVKRVLSPDLRRRYDSFVDGPSTKWWLAEQAFVLAERVRELEEQLGVQRDLLRRLREWDIIAGPGTPKGEFTADAPFWRGELDRVLSNPASSQEDA